MTGRSESQGSEQESNPSAEAAESVPGYRELARIGHGGFSVVYRAVQESFERSVALKILTNVDTDEDARRRFLREVRLASRLSGHPHVVTVLDTGTTESGRPYLAMDLYEGGSMKERLKRTGPLSAAETAMVGAKIAEALAAAHSLGVVHRDVKPNNILVSRFGEPALADFGVSCLLDSGSSASVLDVFSPQHAAPELMARGVPSASSDVYALGSSLYELLVGHSPFGGEGRDVRAIMWATMSEPAPRPDCPELPGLADAIVRALAKDPEDRFADAAEFGRTLRALIPEGAPTKLAMPDLSPTMAMAAAEATVSADPDELLAEVAQGSDTGTGTGTGRGTRAATGSNGSPVENPLEPDSTSARPQRGSDETMLRPDRVDPAANPPERNRGNGLRRARKPLVLLVGISLLGVLGWVVFDSQNPSTPASSDDAAAPRHPLATTAAYASPSHSTARPTRSASSTPSTHGSTTAAATKAAPSASQSPSKVATSASATGTTSSGLSLGTYYRYRNAQSGDCLENPATQSACVSSGSEGWEYSTPLTGILNAVAGEVELVNEQSGDCLTASGGAVSAQTCDGGSEQMWTTLAESGSGSELRNAQAGQCLEASGGGVTVGACSASENADLWSQDGTV